MNSTSVAREIYDEWALLCDEREREYYRGTPLQWSTRPALALVETIVGYATSGEPAPTSVALRHLSLPSSRTSTGRPRTGRLRPKGRELPQCLTSQPPSTAIPWQRGAESGSWNPEQAGSPRSGRLHGLALGSGNIDVLRDASVQWVRANPDLETAMTRLSWLREVLGHWSGVVDTGGVGSFHDLIDFTMTCSSGAIVSDLAGAAVEDPLTGCGNRRLLD